MNTQSLTTVAPNRSTKNAERFSAPQASSDSTSLSPPWATMADAQKVVQPRAASLLQQGLLKPASGSERDPGEPSQLSVEQLIKLVDLTESLAIKLQILRRYVSNRASDLAAKDVVRLAEHAKDPGKWVDSEKRHHDDLFVHYLENRGFEIDPEEAIVLANAAFQTKKFASSLQNYVEKNVRDSALSPEHVIALVQKIPTLSVKMAILNIYVQERSSELSASAVVSLANEARLPGNPPWTDGEKDRHEEILASFLSRRESDLSSEEAVVLAQGSFATGKLDNALTSYVKRHTQNSELSSGQVVQMVAKIEALSTKVDVLNTYLQARATEISADEAIALAGETKTPGDWSDKEKKHHDELLSLWMRRRLEANQISLDGVLKVSRKAFTNATADQMLLDYARGQDLSFDQRIHLAAMARSPKTAEVILK